MKYQFDGVFPKQKIYLTFDVQDFLDPGYVLVFAFYKNQLLLTKHKKRGWELPGGKREKDESPISAAIRETYEETGAELSAIKHIAQYRIESPSAEIQIKTIYLADVWCFHDLPNGFETDAIKLVSELPTSESIKNDPYFSPLLKDDVYRLTRQYVLAQQDFFNKGIK